MTPNPFIQLSVSNSSKAPPGEMRSALTLLLSLAKVHHLPICRCFFSISPCFPIVTSREAIPGRAAPGSVVCNASNASGAGRPGPAGVGGPLEEASPLWWQHEHRLTTAGIKGRTQTGFTGFYWAGNTGVNVKEKCFNLKRKKTCFGAPRERRSPLKPAPTSK